MYKNTISIAHQRIFYPAFRLKLDDSIALSLFDITHIMAFMDADSYTSMFIHELFFPMMAVYGDTTRITDLLACLYVSLFLNLHYLSYYKLYKHVATNVYVQCKEKVVLIFTIFCQQLCQSK